LLKVPEDSVVLVNVRQLAPGLRARRFVIYGMEAS